MTIYIVRFISYGGGPAIDGYFRTEAAARKVYEQSGAALPSKYANAEFQFKDDFGIEIAVQPGKCVRIFTNTKDAAAFSVALNEANRTASQTERFEPPVKANGGHRSPMQ